MITDGNPHQDGLIDHHRLVYLPYSEDKNLVMELPNSPGLFFTSQIISGGEFIVAFDKTMHKYWVISINQVLFQNIKKIQVKPQSWVYDKNY